MTSVGSLDAEKVATEVSVHVLILILIFRKSLGYFVITNINLIKYDSLMEEIKGFQQQPKPMSN